MTQLILACFFVLLSTQLDADDTTPKSGLKCVFFAPMVPHEAEANLRVRPGTVLPGGLMASGLLANPKLRL